MPWLLLLATRIAYASGLPWEIWEAPSRLAVLDAGDSVLEQSSRCTDGCRYDRSNAGAESAASNPYPERWLYRDDDEVVVFDERGPGALTRIWMTTGFATSGCIDPATRARFYVDGAIAPTLDVPLAAVFDGSTPPFTPPLALGRLQSSGGYVSYAPIAYAQGLRIALTGADNGGTNPCTGDARRLLWFQLQHHRLVPGTAVTSFVAGHDEPAWRSFLAHAGDDPWNAMLAPQLATTLLAPATTQSLATRSGAGWLRGIRLHLPRSAYAHVNLRVHVDGDLAIDVPLADFFATAVDAQRPARGVFIGEDAGGWLYAWFPIPFDSSVAVELAAAATLPSPVSVDSAISFDALPVPADAGRFATTLADTCIVGGDFTLFDARGAGKIVGVGARYRADGMVTRAYLEGDERAHVDDAITPAWYGTGVEDFFNGGFYFDQGAYANALSGATSVDADGTGTTAVYRLMPTDALTYASALRLNQEAGFAPLLPVPTCARTIVHAYRREQPLLVGYDGFEIGDIVAAAAHEYVPAGGASCAALGDAFEDEPPTTRNAIACSSGGGSSHFHFHVDDAATPLRLRRTFDVGNGTPGETAGSAPAEIRVNGLVAGAFTAVAANPARRWQQQEALFDVPPGTTDFDVEIVPAVTAATPVFSESRWELRGGWKDHIFANGFD